MTLRERGQALVLALLLIPILLLAFAILGRGGKTLLIDDQIVNHCGKKVLDALAIKGRGLQALGHLNPLARATILARRAIDKLIAASAVAPVEELPLLAARARLMATQRTIQRAQDRIMNSTLSLFKTEINKPSPNGFYGKISEQYRAPSNKFAIQKEAGYENELGAPLEPSPDFDHREKLFGKIDITTEKFLWRWQAPLPLGRQLPLSAKNIKDQCSGKIAMSRLEAPWTAQLVAAEAK